MSTESHTHYENEHNNLPADAVRYNCCECSEIKEAKKIATFNPITNQISFVDTNLLASLSAASH